MNNNNHQGFTLVELLIYTAVVGIFLVAATTFAIDILYGREKSQHQQNIGENARFVLERIVHEIRNADTIVSVTPARLEIIDETGTTIVISLVNATVVITRNGVDTPMSGNQAAITGLTFTDLTSGTSRNIKITLSVSDNELSQTYETAAEVRKKL